MRTFLLFGFMLSLCIGCRKEIDVALPADPRQLVGDWVLVSPQTGYSITLTIEPMIYATNISPPPVYRIRGKGPVNTYEAMLNYAPRGDSTRTGEISLTNPVRGSTLGEDEQARQETELYFNELAGAHSYALTSNGQLRLTYGVWYELNTPPALIYQRQ